MADDEKKAKGGSRLKLIIMIVVGLVLAIALSIAGTLFFLGDSDGSGSKGSGEAQGHVPASYYELEDPIIVSVSGDQQRYAQISLAIVMRENDVSGALKQHLPTLRSRLQSVLQRQEYVELHGTQRKEELAETLLETVNGVLEAEGEAPAERVLFTNFVMQ